MKHEGGTAADRCSPTARIRNIFTDGTGRTGALLRRAELRRIRACFCARTVAHRDFAPAHRPERTGALLRRMGPRRIMTCGMIGG